MSSHFKAEYIWIDGALPTAKLRSKTKIVEHGKELPIWGFDGSSTNQATGHQSDCVLKPVFTCPDPIRGGDDVLVLCEVLLTDMTPHPSNTRAKLVEVAKTYAAHEMWFGIEQEYTFFDGIKPLGALWVAGAHVVLATVWVGKVTGVCHCACSPHEKFC
jgi:glutamine synthetase